VKFSGWKSVFNGFQFGKFFPIFVNMSTQIKFFTNDSNVSVEFVYMHICRTTSLAKKLKQRCRNGIKFVLILVDIKKNIEPCNENIFKKKP